jgi:hypothetical protein
MPAAHLKVLTNTINNSNTNKTINSPILYLSKINITNFTFKRNIVITRDIRRTISHTDFTATVLSPLQAAVAVLRASE